MLRALTVTLLAAVLSACSQTPTASPSVNNDDTPISDLNDTVKIAPYIPQAPLTPKGGVQVVSISLCPVESEPSVELSCENTSFTMYAVPSHIDTKLKGLNDTPAERVIYTSKQVENHEFVLPDQTRQTIKTGLAITVTEPSPARRNLSLHLVKLGKFHTFTLGETSWEMPSTFDVTYETDLPGHGEVLNTVLDGEDRLYRLEISVNNFDAV